MFFEISDGFTIDTKKFVNYTEDVLVYNYAILYGRF